MIKKIYDLPKEETCRSKDHEIPTHIYLPPGIYEHTCSGCRKKTQFTVDAPTL